MTASISPSCKKRPPERPRWLFALGAWLLVACAIAAGRNELEFRYTEAVLVDNAYIVNASIAGEPSSRVEELVQAGINVPFVVEFSLTRPRWYWFDEVIIERNMTLHLSYHALTRQYRLMADDQSRSFASFEQAFNALLAVRNWSVADRRDLTVGESYNASLRFRLDPSQLPKAFQVAAFGNRDLTMTTGWAKWTFLAGPR